MDGLRKQKPADKELKRWEKQLEEEEKKLKFLSDRKTYFESQIEWLNERFPNGVYEDVAGLCKAASLSEVEEQDWSLNPGRYVGVVIEEDGLTEKEFKDWSKKAHFELSVLTKKSVSLMDTITSNAESLLK